MTTEFGMTAVGLASVSEVNKPKLETIFRTNLAHVKARMNVDLPSTPAHLDALEMELKRFLSLFVLEQGNHFFTEAADDLWHYFILHTKDYQRFCDNVYGRFLNHNPQMIAIAVTLLSSVILFL